MDLREHYDPEDIEILLHERGFDELLEEERAYVLRHLAGREEYENMRALLTKVHDDERNRQPIVADDAIRNNVMAAFRAQQQPQWRIWLNSIGTLLWPQEASAFWRPALAFASLALLIVAGVQVVRHMNVGGENTRVAEVKQEEAKTTDFKPVADSVPSVPSVSAPSAGASSNATSALEQPVSGFAELSDTPADAEEVTLAKDLDLKYTSDERKAANKEIREPTRETLDDVQMDRAANVASIKKAETFAAPAQPASTRTASHVVTEAELSRNESTANVRVRAITSGKFKLSQTTAASKSLADDPTVIALVSAGW